MNIPMLPDEGYDEWLKRVRYAAGEITRSASDMGTQIHRAFERNQLAGQGADVRRNRRRQGARRRREPPI